jgi:hypothetical protein
MFLAGLVEKGKRSQKGTDEKKGFIRDSLKLDPRLCVDRLLERRVLEFESGAIKTPDNRNDLSLTLKCLKDIRFQDRPLTDREKLTVLAICRCYDPRVWQRTLINWRGYLKTIRSDELDLPLMLTDFRSGAKQVLYVNRYGLFETARLKGVDG